MANFDLCLGIFGDSLKADIVVPNKAFHYAAMGKCMITKDTTGIREVFTHHENAILCKGNAESIAQEIMRMKKTPMEVQRIGINSLELVKQNYDASIIGNTFMNILRNYKASIL